MPVAAYPALTDVGAWRGHGLAIPPLLGSGPAPFGGSYTARRRSPAGSSGRRRPASMIVPEVDLPGHCFAALAAVPALRDPRRPQRRGQRAVVRRQRAQPGRRRDPAVPRGGRRRARRPVPVAVAARRRRRGARRRVVGLAGRASGYAADAWRQRVAGHRRGVHGRDHRARRGRRRAGRSGCGRRPPSPARCAPGDGYVVGWKSAADCRRLAAAGHAVVASPAERYYLDMAADPAWDAPGTSWAGHSSLGRRRGLRRRPRGGRRRAGRPRSASRPASGPSTPPTARPSNACCSPASTPSPPRPGRRSTDSHARRLRTIRRCAFAVWSPDTMPTARPSSPATPRSTGCDRR